MVACTSKGGILFFLLGLMMLAFLLVLIKRLEAPKKDIAEPADRGLAVAGDRSAPISQGLLQDTRSKN
jgi:hypothetical protein